MSIQGTPEWIQERVGIVTASEVACMMGRNAKGKYYAEREKYLTEIVAERLTNTASDVFVSKYMKRGTEKEPAMIARVEAEFAVLIDSVGLIKHPTISMLGASPDGLSSEFGLEGKCPKTETHINWMEAGICPPEHYAQIQCGMACTGLNRWLFASFDDRIINQDLQLFTVWVDRDDEYLKRMENEVYLFLSEVDDRVRNLLSKVAA